MYLLSEHDLGSDVRDPLRAVLILYPSSLLHDVSYCGNSLLPLTNEPLSRPRKDTYDMMDDSPARPLVVRLSTTNVIQTVRRFPPLCCDPQNPI